MISDVFDIFVPRGIWKEKYWSIEIEKEKYKNVFLIELTWNETFTTFKA